MKTPSEHCPVKLRLHSPTWKQLHVEDNKYQDSNKKKRLRLASGDLPPKSGECPEAHINGQSNPDSDEPMTGRKCKQAENADRRDRNLKMEQLNSYKLHVSSRKSKDNGSF